MHATGDENSLLAKAGGKRASRVGAVTCFDAERINVSQYPKAVVS